jgi:ornithine cyclodeaminase/alanine dehydrogenase-like protein (mu-crystallin family)
VLILSAAEVRRALPMPAVIASQRRAFAALATGQAVLPLRTPVPIPGEEAVTLFMPARVAGDLGAKIVSIFPRNPARGLERIQGVVLLVDATTGRPLALMDATHLTALRTGAVSGLATDLLARPDARTAAILGSGVQAATQLLAVCAVRPIERARVFSRNPQHVAAFISRLQPEVRAVLSPASSAAEAVRDADVVCAATTSATPVLAGEDLRAGTHVNGVGSYTTEAQEVDGATVRRAGMVFVDNRDAALAEAGDVVIPLRQGLIGEDDLVELGSVVVGSHPGRTSPDAVTFFKSVGLAVQDVTAGAEVLRRARELGLGVEVPL